MNPDLIRTILKRLFTADESTGFVRSGTDLSPPWLADYEPEEVGSHLDRLIECGYIIRTNKIKMTYHPDPVTLDPTSKAEGYKYDLFDDEKWNERSAALIEDLEASTS